MADNQQRKVPQDHVPVPQIQLGSSPEDSCREASSSEKAIEGGERFTASRKRSSPFKSGQGSRNPMSVPARSRSAYAAVYTDQFSAAIPKRRAYDSPGDSSGERASSVDVDHSVTHPELLLSQSADSNTCVLMPDVKVAEDNLKQRMDVLRTTCETALASRVLNYQAYAKPISSQTCSPDNAEEVKPSKSVEDEPKSSQNSCLDTVEEVKPNIEEAQKKELDRRDVKAFCETVTCVYLNMKKYMETEKRDRISVPGVGQDTFKEVVPSTAESEQDPMSSQSSTPDTAKLTGEDESSQTSSPGNAEEVKPSTVRDEPKSSQSSSPDIVEEVKPDIEEAQVKAMRDLKAISEGVVHCMYLNIEKYMETEKRDRISVPGVRPDTAKEVVPSTAESEQDPVPSQSSTPDTAKRTGEDEPRSSQTSSPGNVEEVKPSTVRDEPKSSQSSSPDIVEEVNPDIEEAQVKAMRDLKAISEGVVHCMLLNIEKYMNAEKKDRISVLGVSPDTAREVVASTAESEQDRMPSQKSTPDTAKRTGEDEPRSSQTSSHGNVEEVKPTTVEDESMASQSSISRYRRGEAN